MSLRLLNRRVHRQLLRRPVQRAPAARPFENLAALAIRAAELIPVLQSEVESPLLDWFEKISIVLAVIIVMFSFARLWRENAGAGADVFWWFGRLAVCFALWERPLPDQLSQ